MASHLPLLVLCIFTLLCTLLLLWSVAPMEPLDFPCFIGSAQRNAMAPAMARCVHADTPCPRSSNPLQRRLSGSWMFFCEPIFPTGAHFPEAENMHLFAWTTFDMEKVLV